MGTQRSQLDLFSAGAAPPPAATRIQQVQEEREDSLEALTRECVGCQRCDLATTRTHVVISRGNPLARLMLVGEGPGQHEDETGLPFVGRAGRLLDQILASVGLDQEQDIYISKPFAPGWTRWRQVLKTVGRQRPVAGLCAHGAEPGPHLSAG